MTGTGVLGYETKGWANQPYFTSKCLVPTLSFMFLYFRSLSEVRNQMRENRQEMFVFADGTLLGLTREIFIHSSNIYWMHIMYPTHWQGDAEMKASPCPPGSQCRVGRWARNPRTTQQWSPACCVKTAGGKALLSGSVEMAFYVTYSVVLQTLYFRFSTMHLFWRI